MPDPRPGGPTDRPRAPLARTALSSVSLILSRIEGPINLGMVARLCGNLGITSLRLVAPVCSPTDAAAHTLATAWGSATLASATIHATLADATADCALLVGTSGEYRRDRQGPPVDPHHLHELLVRRSPTRWALVFGSESAGLSAQELALCDAWIHLDTFGPNRSYNLAQAVAILGYLIAQQETPSAPPAAAPGVDGATRRVLEAAVLALLRRVEHPPMSDPRYSRRVLGLIRRWDLSDQQAHGVLGMLRSIERALPRSSQPIDPT